MLSFPDGVVHGVLPCYSLSMGNTAARKSCNLPWVGKMAQQAHVQVTLTGSLIQQVYLWVAECQASLLESLYLWLPGRFWPWLHEIQCCLVSLKLTLSSALAHLDRIRHSGRKRTQQLKLAQRGLSRLQKKHVAFQTSCSPKQNQQF